MTEPLLKLIARFDITEDPKHPLNGRAYLSGYNFERAYKGDLVYAVRTLREIADSPELNPPRKGEFKHTIAIMWGLGSDPTNPDAPCHQMIDFLAWQFNEWKENGEIFGWQTKNGKMFESKYGIYPVTCEGGEEILHLEKQHRRENNPLVFKLVGPCLSQFGITDRHNDFCTTYGREKLQEIMQKGSFII